MKPITAEEEYKRNPDLKEEDVKYIKEWVSKQDHLPKCIPDELLLLLLHSCYYSLEATKTTIDNYFTLRTHLPEFFINRIPRSKEIQHVLDTAYLLPLKGRTPDGYRVLVGGLKRFEPSLYEFCDSMKVCYMLLDAWLREEGSAAGFYLVLNLEGLTLGHLPRLHLGIMKKTITYLQDGLPVRLKGVHYINVIPFMDMLMGLMKPFMKKELIDMLSFHTDGMESFYKVVPKSMLPDNLGGTGGTLKSMEDESLRLMYDQESYYKEDEMLRVDETKRPGKAKNPGQLFGVEGSFRKLNID